MSYNIADELLRVHNNELEGARAFIRTDIARMEEWIKNPLQYKGHDIEWAADGGYMVEIRWEYAHQFAGRMHYLHELTRSLGAEFTSYFDSKQIWITADRLTKLYSFINRM